MIIEALCTYLYGETALTIADLAELFAWFGPPEQGFFTLQMAWLVSQQCASFQLATRTQIHSCRWFHGKMTADEAAARAALMPPGSWLFRFSTSEKGGFAFTITERNNRVTHYRVSRDHSTAGRGNFVLRMKPADRSYPTLRALLTGAEELLGLAQPIPGSKLYDKTVFYGGDLASAFRIPRF
jgi:hypothetical protein